MFRYIALAWDAPDAGQAIDPRSLRAALHANPAWQCVLVHPQLSVFCTGTSVGANEALALPDGRGVVLGRLFRRQEPVAQARPVAAGLSPADDLAGTGGQVLVDRYWGRYVAFFESAGQVHVLRDPSGALPCYRLRHAGVTLVFSWLEDVFQLFPHIPAPAIHPQGLAAYMAFGELTGRFTALAGVHQVLAGERLTLSGPAKDASHALWSAAQVATNPADLSVAEALTALRACASHCAAAWAGSYGAILLRLSGGVDSSILAACLAEGRAAARVTCLNYHSPGSDSDERPYARLAAQQARRELIEVERDAAFRLDRVLAVARTPVPSTYVGRITSRSDAEVAARAGAAAMFTGGGGDQLFFEARQWWPAADYLRLRGPGAGFAAATLDAARLGKVSVWRAARLAVADRFRRRPPPLQSLIRRTLITEPVHRVADQPQGLVHPVFFVPTPLPIGKLVQVQQLAYPAGYYDPYARQQAPEQVNPLLSQPLIELCLRLPTFVLTHRGRGRGLARSAFAGVLPPAIARRRSKGGMEEHLSAVLSVNLGFARQLLLDGELVRRGLIDRSAVEAALSGRHAGTRTPVGELHFCIGVEAWLQQASPRPRPPA